MKQSGPLSATIENCPWGDAEAAHEVENDIRSDRCFLNL
jgi:hypothetical protein